MPYAFWFGHKRKWFVGPLLRASGNYKADRTNDIPRRGLAC
jgi:hypothetical protein